MAAAMAGVGDMGEAGADVHRSEEGRGGEECRSRWWPYHLKKKKKRESRGGGVQTSSNTIKKEKQKVGKSEKYRGTTCDVKKQIDKEESDRLGVDSKSL